MIGLAAYEAAPSVQDSRSEVVGEDCRHAVADRAPCDVVGRQDGLHRINNRANAVLVTHDHDHSVHRGHKHHQGHVRAVGKAGVEPRRVVWVRRDACLSTNLLHTPYTAVVLRCGSECRHARPHVRGHRCRVDHRVPSVHPAWNTWRHGAWLNGAGHSCAVMVRESELRHSADLRSRKCVCDTLSKFQIVEVSDCRSFRLLLLLKFHNLNKRGDKKVTIITTQFNNNIIYPAQCT